MGTMVKAKEMCFIGGSRRRPGQVFEYRGKKLPKYLEPVEEMAKPEEGEESDPADELTKLRRKLEDYGVKVPPRAGKEWMEKKIAETEGKAE